MKTRYKWLIGLVIIGGIGAIILWISRLPVKGKINYQNVNLPSPTMMEYIRYDGENISFAYEGNYELRQNPKVGAMLENIILIPPSGNSDTWVVTVNPGNNYQEDSGYIMREIKSNEYVKTDYKNGILFEAKDSQEMVYYGIYGDKFLIVAMKANSNVNQEYMVRLEKLIDSVK